MLRSRYDVNPPLYDWNYPSSALYHTCYGINISIPPYVFIFKGPGRYTAIPLNHLFYILFFTSFYTFYSSIYIFNVIYRYQHFRYRYINIPPEYRYCWYLLIFFRSLLLQKKKTFWKLCVIRKILWGFWQHFWKNLLKF